MAKQVWRKGRFLLAGMAGVGALGMLAMKEAGAYNFAQNEASCVVFGMPKEAIAAGGVDEVLPLGDIAGAVVRQLMTMGTRAIRV